MRPRSNGFLARARPGSHFGAPAFRRERSDRGRPVRPAYVHLSIAGSEALAPGFSRFLASTK